LSESPFGHRAIARDFPRRNRIVTGLSEGVLLIEAAERSGSLISARTALEQNRDVFAVPGSPLDPRYAGTNRLIRDGALLVRNADDILEALTKPNSRHLDAPAPIEFEPMQGGLDTIPPEQVAAVQSVLALTPVLIDDIARAADIGVRRCAAIIVELELKGIATTHSGGLASLAIE